MMASGANVPATSKDVLRAARQAFETPPSESELAMTVTDLRHEFSQQVFFRRQERQWTVMEVARRAGLRTEAVASMEAGHKSPGFRTLIRFAMAFDCEPWELLRPLFASGET